MWKLFLVGVLGLHQTALCGFEHRANGSRSFALGGAVAALAGEVWASDGNVGSLARLRRNEIAFTYSPQPFGLSELGSAAVALAHRFQFGVTAISASRYGFDLYREVTTSLSFAVEINGIGVGSTLHYQSVVIQNYGSGGAIGVDLGVWAPVTPRLSIGGSAHHLNTPTIGTSDEALVQRFSIGIAYESSLNILLLFDYQKMVGSQASACFGSEYRLTDAFSLRAGFAEIPSLTTGGVGILYGTVKLDYALTYHGELGWTHRATLALGWGE